MSASITVPLETLQQILERIQDAGQYLEGMKPGPSEFAPVYASRKKIAEAAIALYGVINPEPDVKPCGDRDHGLIFEM